MPLVYLGAVCVQWFAPDCSLGQTLASMKPVCHFLAFDNPAAPNLEERFVLVICQGDLYDEGSTTLVPRGGCSSWHAVGGKVPGAVSLLHFQFN